MDGRDNLCRHDRLEVTFIYALVIKKDVELQRPGSVGNQAYTQSEIPNALTQVTQSELRLLTFTGPPVH